MTLIDETGEPVTVTPGDGRFTIAVDGKAVGLTASADHEGPDHGQLQMLTKYIPGIAHMSPPP